VKELNRSCGGLQHYPSRSPRSTLSSASRHPPPNEARRVRRSTAVPAALELRSRRRSRRERQRVSAARSGLAFPRATLGRRRYRRRAQRRAAGRICSSNLRAGMSAHTTCRTRGCPPSATLRQSRTPSPLGVTLTWVAASARHVDYSRSALRSEGLKRDPCEMHVPNREVGTRVLMVFQATA
jgi:hypothetical protein